MGRHTGHVRHLIGHMLGAAGLNILVGNGALCPQGFAVGAQVLKRLQFKVAGAPKNNMAVQGLGILIFDNLERKDVLIPLGGGIHVGDGDALVKGVSIGIIIHSFLFQIV